MHDRYIEFTDKEVFCRGILVFKLFYPYKSSRGIARYDISHI